MTARIFYRNQSIPEKIYNVESVKETGNPFSVIIFNKFGGEPKILTNVRGINLEPMDDQ